MKKKIFGTAEKPRISVFKSNTSIYTQIIDDSKGVTLHSCSSRTIQDKKKNCTLEVAKKVGLELGQKAVQAGISKVIFDREGYKFHGQVKALADGARESGLVF